MSSVEDIAIFAENFLAKLSSLSVQYDPNYNKAPSRSQPPPPPPQVGKSTAFIEIPIKRLYDSPKSGTIKFSRTEKSLSKLRNEVSKFLTCGEEHVTLVLHGKVLGDSDINEVTNSNGSHNIYVFDKRRFHGTEGLGDEFKNDLEMLLQKYGRPDAKIIAQRFMEDYSKWTT